jgi:hypothetical protein
MVFTDLKELLKHIRRGRFPTISCDGDKGKTVGFMCLIDYKDQDTLYTIDIKDFLHAADKYPELFALVDETGKRAKLAAYMASTDLQDFDELLGTTGIFSELSVGARITWESSEKGKLHTDHVVSFDHKMVYTTGRIFVSRSRITKICPVNDTLYTEAKSLP